MCGECYEHCHEKTSFLSYMQWGRSAIVQADKGFLLCVALILIKCNDLFNLKPIKLDSLAAQASDIDINFIDRFSHNEALTLKCLKMGKICRHNINIGSSIYTK